MFLVSVRLVLAYERLEVDHQIEGHGESLLKMSKFQNVVRLFVVVCAATGILRRFGPNVLPLPVAEISIYAEEIFDPLGILTFRRVSRRRSHCLGLCRRLFSLRFARGEGHPAGLVLPASGDVIVQYALLPKAVQTVRTDELRMLVIIDAGQQPRQISDECVMKKFPPVFVHPREQQKIYLKFSLGVFSHTKRNDLSVFLFVAEDIDADARILLLKLCNVVYGHRRWNAVHV